MKEKRPMLLQSRLIRHSFRTYRSGFNWENSTLTAPEAESLQGPPHCVKYSQA